MSFLWKWLRPERPSGVALHPSQTVELDLPYDAAFTRCIEGIERVLGGVVREREVQRGRIDATFGLVNSERLSVTVERIDDNRTRAIVESRRNVSMEPARSSQYVSALAEFLRSVKPRE